MRKEERAALNLLGSTENLYYSLTTLSNVVSMPLILSTRTTTIIHVLCIRRAVIDRQLDLKSMISLPQDNTGKPAATPAIGKHYNYKHLC